MPSLPRSQLRPTAPPFSPPLLLEVCLDVEHDLDLLTDCDATAGNGAAVTDPEVVAVDLGVAEKLGSSAAGPAAGAARGKPSRVLATVSSRCNSASMESVPNLARPSAVGVSMPCSSTRGSTPRSGSAAPRVTRCSTERARPRRVTMRGVPAAEVAQQQVGLRPAGLGAAGLVEVDVAFCDAGSSMGERGGSDSRGLRRAFAGDMWWVPTIP